MWNAECGMRNGSATVDSAFRTPHSALAAVLNVALTGNIAAGKSTVVDLFRRWGATIVDADVLVREAQAPGGEVLAAIAGRFGADVLASDGTLDRAALRGKVMGDQAALDALNQIVHPAVRRRREELLREAREGGDLLVVNDIPLLFEALDPAQFDAVVLVDAAVALRRARRHRRDRGRGSGGRAGVGGRGPSGRADVPLGGPRPRRGAARSPALGRRAGPLGRARCGRPGAPVRSVSICQPVALTEVRCPGNLRRDLSRPRSPTLHGEHSGRSALHQRA